MSEGKTIEILQPERCSGCGACSNACPKNAIRMEQDAEGFFAPVIDHGLCVNCGRCEAVCPVLHVPRANEEEPLCFAVKGSPKILKGSTSGGVFAVLADWILNKGGAVCGAAYDEHFEVHHVIAESSGGVKRIKRTKYVQSQTDDVYRQVRKLLSEGRLVLFSGTPCQVAGLHSYLGRSYDNLYTMDIICHGVPSPGVWAKYLKEEVAMEQLEDIDFRHKGKHGFKRHHICFTYKNGEKVIQPSSRNPFFRHYTRNLGLRRSCASCEFAVFPRQGDFSAGDFWGAAKLYPELVNSDEGISIFFFNNEHARELLPELEKAFAVWKPITPQEAMTGNRKHVTRTMHENRDMFFDLVWKNTVRVASRRCLDWHRETSDVPLTEEQKAEAARKAEERRRMRVPGNASKQHYDVALYGSTMGKNYGSLITYYAAYQSVKKLGYSVVLLQPPLGREAVQEKDHGARFCRQYMEISDKIPMECFPEIYGKMADIFMLGSDQIWNNTLFPGRQETMYLDFVDDRHKKIAYAASFGFNRPTILESHPERFPKITGLMHRLDAIAVRETEAVEVCDHYYDIPAEAVMDPVFLLDPADYQVLTDTVAEERRPKSPYMAVYALSPKPAINQVFQYVSRELGLPRVNMATGNPAKFLAKMKNFDEPYCQDLQLEEWLYNIKNADFVVTDSFHCTCFSIMFHKKFVVIQKSWAVSRIRSLLTLLNLTDRWFETLEDLKAHPEVLREEIDYEAVDRLLEGERERSRLWLKEALKAPKKVHFFRNPRMNLKQMIRYRELYRSKTLPEWFEKYREKRSDLILLILKQGESGKYLASLEFPKGSKIGAQTKSQMDEGFAYLWDGASDEKIKKTGEFAHFKYEADRVMFIADSEGPDTLPAEKVTEICVEQDGRRVIYPCREDGLYFMLYSHSWRRVIDFIRVDTGDSRLSVVPVRLQK